MSGAGALEEPAASPLTFPLPCHWPRAGFERCDLFNSIGPIFVVQSLGAGSAPKSGFSISPAEVDWMLASWQPCRSMTWASTSTALPK